MEPWIGVCLSEPMAAQLAQAAHRRDVTKSAIIEAALTHFLAAGGDIEGASVELRLCAISQHIEELHHDLRVLNEAVALQARFLLAVTPPLTGVDQSAACTLGVARFEEFAAQVAKRVNLGTSLIKETIERLGASGLEHPTTEPEGKRPQARSTIPEFKSCTASVANREARRPPAGREGSYEQAANLFGGQETITPKSRVVRPAVGTARREGSGTRTWVLILRVFLPFVAAYYLSFLFRTINATIAQPLISEFGFGAGDIGLLTSVYLLTIGAAQIPIGVLLDRYGPRRIQSVLLLAAAGGAALFSASDNFWLLLLGRALIGLGVSAALTSGLKAIVLWFPSDRAPLLNGVMIMLAGLGAVTATLPAEYLLVSIGWRGLFELLAITSVGCALAIFLVVPKDRSASLEKGAIIDLRLIYSDVRFWRLAPLSATCIGTAWALQGLWAAQWFSDVERLDRPDLLRNLFIMAIVSSAGALVFGVVAHKLRRHGIGPGVLLGSVAVGFFVAQLAVIFRPPLSSTIPWAVVATVGTSTVLSYATLAEYFPKGFAGRANALLTVLHIGYAFLVQYLVGFVVQRWTAQHGHYPEIAYQVAFALNLAVQIAAWIWFVISAQKSRA